MEVQNAQTTTVKQPCTVRAKLHVSYPHHDMTHERESKLSTFADSCPAPTRAGQMIFSGLTVLNQLLVFRNQHHRMAFTLKRKKSHSTQHEVVKNLGVKGIHSPKGKPCKDNIAVWNSAESFQRVNHRTA